MKLSFQVIVELQAISGTPLADITDVCVAITESITEKQKSLNIHDSDNDVLVEDCCTKYSLFPIQLNRKLIFFQFF